MFFPIGHLWRKGILGGGQKPGFSKKPGFRNRARHGQRFIPHVEDLEGRLAPAVLTVNTLVDETTADSALSLREAIQVVNTQSTAGLSAAELAQISGTLGSNDTILFATGLNGTSTLTGGQLAITRSVDIEGPGPNQLTISGNLASRVFDVGGGSTATIAGMTITDGLAQGAGTGGGGILNEPGANLNLNNLSFIGNQAVADVGGAIWNEAGATATVNACSFTNNQNVGLPDGFAEGGAIDNDGAMSVVASTFTGNQAIAGNGAAFSNGHGGAIGNDGILSVTGSTFVANQALGGTVNNGVTLLAQGLGGAIDNFNALTVSGSTFSNNQAIGGPGATSLPNPRLSAGVGGAIQSISGTVTISGSSFSGNQAIGGAGGTGGAGGVGFGGGLEARSCVLTLSDSTFSHNAAIGGAGGSGAVGGNAVGGGVAVDRGSTATITNITVSHNQALGGVGGDGANGGNAWAGGLDVGGFSIFGISDSTSVSLSGSTLSNNLAIGGDGGAGGNGGNGSGGGVFIGTGATLIVSACTITANHANGGSAGLGGSDGLGIGGGVYNLGTFTFDVVTVITQNHASTSNDNIFP